MRNVLNEVIDAIQTALPANRIVMLVSLLVVAPIVGSVNAYLATKFPGVEFPTEAISAAFLLGLGGTVAALYKWIDGQQAHENREDWNLREARASERLEAEAKLRQAPPPEAVVGIETLADLAEQVKATRDAMEAGEIDRSKDTVLGQLDGVLRVLEQFLARQATAKQPEGPELTSSITLPAPE